jgi:hypothetical protein
VSHRRAAVDSSVARRGNRGWSTYGAQRLQPVAIGGKCDVPKTTQTSENRCRELRQLPEPFHGKEEVDGSSPSEGSAKAAQIESFLIELSCATSTALGMEPFTELPGSERALRGAKNRPASTFAMKSSPASVSVGTRIRSSASAASAPCGSKADGRSTPLATARRRTWNAAFALARNHATRCPARPCSTRTRTSCARDLTASFGTRSLSGTRSSLG